MIDIIIENKEFLAIALSAIAILFGIRGNNRQLSSAAFIAYTEKFDSLNVHNFDEWKRRNELDAELIEYSSRLKTSLDKYIHLCCQQFYLYKKGMIREAVWNIWEPEIEHNLKTDLIKGYWKVQGPEYFFLYEEFKIYVDCVQSPSSRNCAKTYNKWFQRTLRLTTRR